MKRDLETVEWTAEEYVEKKRNRGWYIGLLVVVVLFSILAILLKWWTFLILVILSAVAVLTSNLKPPRKINYSLDKNGLTEGNQLHKFEDYKAFGILKEDANFAAVLMPKKRFGLQVKVYFPEKNGENIVDFLGARLPMEEVKKDFLDKIVDFLRI